MPWCEHDFEKLWISGSFSSVDSVNLLWQMAALCSRQSSCCERLSISAAAETSSTSFVRSRCQSSCCERLSISDAAETSSTSFARSRYSRALLLSLNVPNTALAPDVCKRLFWLGIYDRNQACPLWKREKRLYTAGCKHRGKTVDTIWQKHPLRFTRYADKLCSCFAISDGLLDLPTNLEGHVCSAQLSDRVDQLDISYSSTLQASEETPVPWRSSQAGPDYPCHCHRQIAAPDPSPSLHFDS